MEVAGLSVSLPIVHPVVSRALAGRPLAAFRLRIGALRMGTLDALLRVGTLGSLVSVGTVGALVKVGSPGAPVRMGTVGALVMIGKGA